MVRSVLSAFCTILLLTSVCHGAEVPDELTRWREWVLHGQEEQVCPPAFNSQGAARCLWPTSTDLALSRKGGRFEMRVAVFAASWVVLPGGPGAWPQNVLVRGKPEEVTLRQGAPALRLSPGEYGITGEFLWERMPESLPVPRDSGLVSLTVDGTRLGFPDLRSGRLWLKEKAPEDRSVEDTLELQVYRLLDDAVPFGALTRLELDVSGQQREVLVGPVLPVQGDGRMFTPVQLASPLTARVESDGRLRLQVRPGHWRVDVRSRSLDPVRTLAVPALQDPWPGEEIWVLSAHTDLRVVEPAGLVPVDPSQTTLPVEWRELPAFAARPGQVLELNVIRRGDTDPAPDRLTISREMWLDFNGDGYTVLDRIGGTMSRSRRLESAEGLDIGRVVLSGEDMLITTLPGSERPGVEIRRGEVDVTAASRMDGSVSRFPTSGWNHDFTSVSARLHLPPGWEVLAVAGTDNRPQTWLQRWTLLDLFLVLIISIATFRMLGRPAGALALGALALSWHAPYAPASIWLHILIAMALARYLPEGRLRRLSRAYRLAAFALLILLFIPFAVDQVRTALYPQLEERGVLSFVPGPAAMKRAEPAPQREMDVSSVDALSRKAPAAGIPSEIPAEEESIGLFRLPSNLMLQQLDKDALVQTGPGLPTWSWRTIALQFTGPVNRDQRLRVFYLPPLANSAARILRVFLVALLGLVMAGVRLPLAGSAFVKAALLAALLLPAGQARAAEFPPPELLKEYQARLLEPPRCLPDCAQASRMRLQADPQSLRLLVEIHALAEVAVPLPGTESQWLPEKVTVDGRPPRGLARTGDGTLWSFLDPGVHQVILEGRLPPRSTVQIPLLLPVHLVQAGVRGWTLEGVHENGVPDRQLQLTRVRPEGTLTGEMPPLEAGSLPPFVMVERTLMLGLEWRSRTAVTRLSPPGTAVVLEVPLLDGESVITEGVRVQEGRVLVNMGPNQHTMVWDSALKVSEELRLTAPVTDRWVESWKAEISPIWHMEQTEGIAVIHRADPRGVWAPVWRPWPGEEVRLAVIRPRGVPGSTFTIDGSTLELEPGKSATDAVLGFTARSSLGGQHVVTLPAGAELTAVTLDGLLQPIRPEEGRLTLPVHPGTQSYEISWRQPGGIGALYRTLAPDLGTASVNQHLKVTMPRNRWTLFAGGPRLGPAVLFWSILAVVFLLAYGLSRTGLTPLKGWQWALLGLGLTQVWLPVAAVIVGWLLALGLRSRVPEDLDARSFNVMQIGLAGLTLLAAAALVGAVKKGLLGYPEMQVMGNGSTAYNLLWYADRVGGSAARAWILSVPMLFYRLLMLAWALWLASSLIGWLKWGWEAFTRGGYWKKMEGFKPGRKGRRGEEAEEG